MLSYMRLLVKLSSSRKRLAVMFYSLRKEETLRTRLGKVSAICMRVTILASI